MLGGAAGLAVPPGAGAATLPEELAEGALALAAGAACEVALVLSGTAGLAAAPEAGAEEATGGAPAAVAPAGAPLAAAATGAVEEPEAAAGAGAAAGFAAAGGFGGTCIPFSRVASPQARGFDFSLA